MMSFHSYYSQVDESVYYIHFQACVTGFSKIRCRFTQCGFQNTSKYYPHGHGPIWTYGNEMWKIMIVSFLFPSIGSSIQITWSIMLCVYLDVIFSTRFSCTFLYRFRLITLINNHVYWFILAWLLLIMLAINLWSQYLKTRALLIQPVPIQYATNTTAKWWNIHFLSNESGLAINFTSITK